MRPVRVAVDRAAPDVLSGRLPDCSFGGGFICLETESETLRVPSVSHEFAWDATKATYHRKHGVSFHEASTVFADPLALLMRDPDHSLDEERYLVLGASSAGRLLVVSHTERPPRTRIISARPATRNERSHYEQGI